MALISCISCGARISDKAVACPKCGWTNQSEPPLANTEELRIEEERKAELNKKRDYYLGLQANKVNKKEKKRFNVFKACLVLSSVIITFFVIIAILPESTFYECGEKYWNSDRGRWVKKRC